MNEHKKKGFPNGFWSPETKWKGDRERHKFVDRKTCIKNYLKLGKKSINNNNKPTTYNNKPTFKFKM